MRRLPGSRGTGGSAIVALGIIYLLFYAVSGSAEEIVGCVGKSGNLRIVSSPAECKNNETVLSWNVQGPAGEKGDQGDQGPQGKPGPPGDSPVSLCGVNEVLTGDGRCAALTPAALCGNGQVDPGEECDPADETRPPDTLCSSSCEIVQCPCQYADVPFSTWESEPGIIYFADSNSCDLFTPDLVPQLNIIGFSCTISLPFVGSVAFASGLSDLEIQACSRDLQDYVSQLSATGVFVEDLSDNPGDGMFICPLGDSSDIAG